MDFISCTTKTKTLEVEGGFYSKEDMKTELNYSQSLGSEPPCRHRPRDRIDKIAKWAAEKNLVRPLDCTHVCRGYSKQIRTCEYDDTTLEYWCNIRTKGSLKREDLEEVCRKRSYEDMVGADDCLSHVQDFEPGPFASLGSEGMAMVEQEGLGQKTVP